jgi:hypothetical protein
MFLNEENDFNQEDDDFGTSPINLPDPSLFSDLHDNDVGGEPTPMRKVSSGKRRSDTFPNTQNLEDEIEKRRLE